VPRNLELKCRIASVADACKRACECGARPHGILEQVDTYFVVPHCRMKLREFGDGSAELITYLRANTGGERWSSYRKIDVPPRNGLKESLGEALGIRCVVRKRRHLFLIDGARIHIDEVDGLGSFLEFEVTVENQEQAGSIMQGLIAAFALNAEEGIAGSYADLICGG
jgi:predicted adenylyl cyclase CyaB